MLKHNQLYSKTLYFLGILSFTFSFNVFSANAATTIFSDTFTGSNSLISSHTPDTGTGWTLLVNNGITISARSSTPGYAAVTSNTMNAGSIYTADATYPSADYEISLDAIFAAGDSNYTRSLVLRAQDSNNMYLLRVTNSTMTIYKRVSGTWTSLASGSGVGLSDNVSSPYHIAVLTFRVVGNTLTGKVDGVTKVTVDDSDITLAGKAGIGLGYTAVSTDDGGTGVEIDDVLVQTATDDVTAPTVSEVTAVTTPTSDSTPDYVFTTDEVGTISYGGSCDSATTDATVGSNTITFSSLADGTYSDCTITITDSSSNVSNPLSITAFVVDTTGPTISSISSTSSATSSTITWTTDEDSSSQILYGLTDSYETNTTEIDTSPRVTSHSIELSGLTCNTTYYYKVISKDVTENTSDDNDNTFTTLSCPVAARTSSSTSASTRVRNLIQMGKLTEAQKIMNQFPDATQSINLSSLDLVKNTNQEKDQKILDLKLEKKDIEENIVKINLDIPNEIIFFKKTLKPGTTGEDVKTLQKFLNNNGFPLINEGPGSKGQETKFFGELSANALIKFQNSKGLPSDGIMGPMTRKAINDILSQK